MGHSLNKFILTYEINEDTIAIEPANQNEHGAIVFETEEQYFVKQTPLDIIKKACIKYGSTYEGRKESVMKKLGFHGKVPIPISILSDIYAFPTHSPDESVCTWIIKKHLEFVQPIESSNENEQSLIVFKGGRELVSDLPVQLLYAQMDRTEICKSFFMSPPETRLEPRVEYNRRYWGMEIE